MRIPLGIDDYSFRRENRKIPVVIDLAQTINGHMLFMGKSGTGKTHMIRKVLSSMLKQASTDLRVHIMDVHGDIEIPGASTVKFSESSPYGFNPLLINPDPDFGGVRKRIQGFINALNRAQAKLGTRQESCLRNLLTDLYTANGFYKEKPESWKLDDGAYRRFPKKNPTLLDAFKFAEYKLKSMTTGAPSKAMKSLEDLAKKHQSRAIKRRQLAKAGQSSSEEVEKLESQIQEQGEELIAIFTDYIHSQQTGTEMDDWIKYDSKDVLKSVSERLGGLVETGIFKDKNPPFESSSPIWRYDIKALSESEKILFVMFRLEEIFTHALQRGVQDRIRDVIVLDEAHNFFSDDGDNIINKIAKEARKFGVALIAASQSPTHFSEDFLTNVGTKMILGLDQTFWDNAVRKLKIENKVLEYVVPHQSIAVQISNKGDLKARFRNVNVREE